MHMKLSQSLKLMLVLSGFLMLLTSVSHGVKFHQDSSTISERAQKLARVKSATELLTELTAQYPDEINSSTYQDLAKRLAAMKGIIEFNPNHNDTEGVLANLEGAIREYREGLMAQSQNSNTEGSDNPSSGDSRTLVMVKVTPLGQDGSYIAPKVHGLEEGSAQDIDYATLIGGGYELVGVQGGSSDLLRLSYMTYNSINNHLSSPRHAVVDQSNLSSHTFEKVVTLPMIKGKYKVRVEVNHTTLGAAVAEPSAVSGFEDTPVVLVTIELLRIV